MRAGADLFAYDVENLADLAQLGGDTINGFTKGVDKIDVSDLLGDFNIDNDHAFDGFVQLQASGANTLILIDAGGGGAPTLLATVTNATLTESDFLQEL